MHLERIFATPNSIAPYQQWAIWALVHDHDGIVGCNEVIWFSIVWTHDEYISAELDRIMALPKSYITLENPTILQVKKEADQLFQAIYPAQLINSRAKNIALDCSKHLAKMSLNWEPLENVPNPKDLRLKAKAKKLETAFLRIYAICVRPNVYIITGSVLKGTPEKIEKPFIDSKIKEQFVRTKRLLKELTELGLDEDPDRFFESTPIDLL